MLAAGLELAPRGAPRRRGARGRASGCARAGSASPGRATPRRPLFHASRIGASIVAALPARLALDDREVAPLDAVVAEGVDEPGPGLSREREGDGARGVAVEPVHALGVARPRLEAQGVLLHAPQGRVLVVGARGRRARSAGRPASRRRGRARPRGERPASSGRGGGPCGSGRRRRPRPSATSRPASRTLTPSTLTCPFSITSRALRRERSGWRRMRARSRRMSGPSVRRGGGGRQVRPG